MGGQKRCRVREKDAFRKKEKREKEKQQKHYISITPKTEVLLKATGFKTQSAKRLARYRMWKKRPSDPEKFVDIVMDFITVIHTAHLGSRLH